MRYGLIMFICLYMLFVLTVNVKASKNIDVASSGESVVTAKSAKYNIRVIIKTRRVEKNFEETWDKKLHFVPSTCTFLSSCSIVNKIEIIVNGKKIFIPHSLLSDLAAVTTAEVRIYGEHMMLLLEAGDASEAVFVKIEFDPERVTKMSIFANMAGDDSMAADLLLQETTYHLVHLGS